MIEIEELVRLGRGFAKGPFEPLYVTAVLWPGAPVANYEPIQFDGLLAKGVIVAGLRHQTLPDTDEAYWIPLPLKMLWQHPDGRPLWAASVMYQYGEAVEDVAYLHKRAADMRFSDSAHLNTKSGRYVDRRIPVPTVAPEALQARVIGNREWLEYLLPQFVHVGKHAARGFGGIREWRVRPGDFSERDTYICDGALCRPMPVDYNELTLEAPPSRIGWTPPQWKPSLHSLGWPAGTPVGEAAPESAHIDPELLRQARRPQRLDTEGAGTAPSAKLDFFADLEQLT